MDWLFKFSPLQFWIFIFLVVMAVFSLAGVFLLKRGKKPRQEIAKPQPTRPQLSADIPKPSLVGILSKTRQAWSEKLEKLLLSTKKIDDEFLEHLEELLYTSDLGPATVEKLLESVRKSLSRGEISDHQKVKEALRAGIVEILDRSKKDGREGNPNVILVVGVNGVGKTTSIGKLAYYYSKLGKSVTVVAADTFRAAAEKQLGVWADRAGVTFFASDKTTDPAAVAYQGLEKALADKKQVVIVDTAGRLHNKENLMEELKKVKRVLQKLLPDAPHQILLVVDANSGQNALAQAKQFNEALDLTGLIVTKLDGSAKGGVIVGISDSIGINPDFIGLGEKMTDLEPFSATEYAKGILS